MMLFDFGEWAIESDKFGWQIQRRRTVQSGKGEGQSVVDRRLYYSSLEGAFMALPDAVLRHHEGYGVLAGMEANQELGAKLAKMYDKGRLKGVA